MPTYIVKRTLPVLVTVVVEAKTKDQAEELSRLAFAASDSMSLYNASYVVEETDVRL